MKSYIIGTAGHVDHGKSALIKALTGIDTDRLKEEKQRGISIELGFASLLLPSGVKAGVVDVPGHEKFVRQMLAGIGGIDLVLLVIAADEGVMPQTREHLDIIDLLQISKGLVVLTKADLVEQDWLELVRLEVIEVLKGTVLENAEIIEVSSVSGLGIQDLKNSIDRELAQISGKTDVGPCRLPIDRSFTVQGFGTVVTGTMYRGRLQLGDPVIVEPGGLVSKVRSMQVHGSKVEEAFAGQRVAVNLPNIELNDLPKGATVLSPDYLQSTQIVDVSLSYLASNPVPLNQRQRVRFHIGTREVLGRVHLLDSDNLQPGNKAYAQILLEEPVVAARQDRFILRFYSPARTIAGGTILDTGNRKFKRFSEQVAEQMAIKEKGTPEDLVLEQLRKSNIPATSKDLVNIFGLTIQEIEVALNVLGPLAACIDVEGQSYWFSPEAFVPVTTQIVKQIQNYHQSYSLRPGMLKEEIKSRHFSHWSNKLFSAMLNYWEAKHVLVVAGNFLSLPGFRPEAQGNVQKQLSGIVDEFTAAGLAPPDWGAVMDRYRIEQQLRDELLQYCLRTNILVKVNPNLLFSASALAKAKESIEELLAQQSEFQAAEVKDKLQTSRKYLIPILEYFDAQKVTRRIGEKRVKF